MECRVCGSDSLKYYYSLGNQKQYNYYKCNNCKLINLDLTGLRHTENQDKYSIEYKDPFSKKGNRGNYNTSQFINKHIKSKGDFLDIGCGNGSLLNFLKESGWNVKGLELTEFLANKVTEVLGIEVDLANFMDLNNINVKYDSLSLRHVLEHLPNSNLALENIKRLLKPNGYAVLEFPNIEGLSFKIKRFFERIGLLKITYTDDFVPGHCNEFSKESFKYLANKAGFQVIKWETYSSKSFFNLFLKVFNVGTKARVLIKNRIEI